MLVSPEALPQEVVDEQPRLNLGLASPHSRCKRCTPKGRHLHPFDWINTPARLLASRPDTANAWPVVVAQLHMHLGPRRTRRPAFGASHGRGMAFHRVVQVARLRRRSCSRWSGNRATVSETRPMVLAKGHNARWPLTSPHRWRSWTPSRPRKRPGETAMCTAVPGRLLTGKRSQVQALSRPPPALTSRNAGQFAVWGRFGGPWTG
jgi:hypothetical protein